MKKYIVLFLTILLSLSIDAENRDLNPLFKQLDDAIAHSGKYVKVRESRIADLHRQLRTAHGQAGRYAIHMKLFDEYKAYISDSAIHHISECIRTARQMKRKDLEGDALALLAFQCSTVGSYFESLSALRTIDTRALTRQGRIDYLIACRHVYQETGVYSRVRHLGEEYTRKGKLYEDSLLSEIDKTSPNYYLYKGLALIQQRRYTEAFQLNDAWLRLVKPSDRDFAIAAYYRFRIYSAMGNNPYQIRYWLLKSAICDITHAVMDQGSLWSLAQVIENDVDIERQHQYIMFSWNCALKFGTRLRSQQISPILTSIEDGYQKAQNRRFIIVTSLTVGISLLAVALLLTLLYVNKQRRWLAEVRENLRTSNSQLVALNTKLREANTDLDDTNSKLKTANQDMVLANARLNESNRVKEEYIGRFLEQCSSYIDKMGKFRHQVNKMVKNRQLDELYKLTLSTEEKDKELDTLYHEFDSTFLHLFPNFVSEFNAILQDDHHVEAPKGELNTTLRIFALIRLGIDDSSKIAEFLNYSVNTIYNYRARVKNWALVDRDDFEKRVKELGLNE